MPQAIVLAGGTSKRAKANKLLFLVDDKPLLEHAIDSLLPFVDRVFVVTGHYHKEIVSLLKGKPSVEWVYNPEYTNGMFTSVLAGVQQVSDHFFILPGDCPFVSGETLEQLLHTSGAIRVPTYKDRRGHPIWFDILYKPLLLEEPKQSSLKAFRNRYPITHINTDDQEILTDIDTILDYQNHKKQKETD